MKAARKATAAKSIAHSFVRSKQDVLDIQAILDAHGSLTIIHKLP